MPGPPLTRGLCGCLLRGKFSAEVWAVAIDPESGRRGRPKPAQRDLAGDGRRHHGGADNLGEIHRLVHFCRYSRRRQAILDEPLRRHVAGENAFLGLPHASVVQAPQETLGIGFSQSLRGQFASGG
jgi:hypothetical protein